MINIKRLTNMTSESYILTIDAYGLFLSWSEKDGIIYDVKLKFHDTHPSYGNVLTDKSERYDVEDIDLKTFSKDINNLIRYFSVRTHEIKTPSMYYEGTYEKKFIIASHNRLILRILELIKYYTEHPTGDIL